MQNVCSIGDNVVMKAAKLSSMCTTSNKARRIDSCYVLLFSFSFPFFGFLLFFVTKREKRVLIKYISIPNAE